MAATILSILPRGLAPRGVALRAVACAALAAVVALLSGAQRETDEPRAPDGKPGFGSQVTIRDLRSLFQSRLERGEAGNDPDEGQAFVAGLEALESEIRVLAARFEDRYREAGYGALVEKRGEPTLEELHAAWRAGRVAPIEAMLARGDRGRAFREVCADVRFRVRARVLEGVEDELRELRGALALMRAQFDGYADLQPHEAAQLGRRADVAASVLRAVRLDLDALREDRGPDPEALAAFDGLGAGGARGREALERSRVQLERLDGVEERLWSALFTARPSEELRTALAWRARQIGGVGLVLEQVRVLSPIVTPEKEAPSDVAELGKSKRHELAARAAVEGLSLDLLNDELYFLLGESSDFQWGNLESRRWFDRYLALHGIRAHDHRSYDLKTMDERERRALERVQTPLVVPR